MSRPGIVDFIKVGDEETGYLSMAQEGNPLPFTPSRTYWVYGNKPGQVKGNHAAKQNKQVVVVLQGMVEAELTNLEGQKSVYTLYNPAQGLYIPVMHWRKIKIVEPSIIMVLCSQQYSGQDEISDFEEFKRLSI